MELCSWGWISHLTNSPHVCQGHLNIRAPIVIPLSTAQQNQTGFGNLPACILLEVATTLQISEQTQIASTSLYVQLTHSKAARW